MPARPFATLAFTLLAGCASTAAQPPAPVADVPFVTSSGLVIGTLSYQYVDQGAAPSGPWVVHFQRIDAPSTQDYALAVDVDPARHSGVFTGTLPAGVYSFRAAASDNRHFDAGAMKLPFEIQPGEVRDAGHYALRPLQGR
ncbi:MAG TPA: hypothetical protein VM240_13165 [Verrucomicrobiae bacterium]|nr:hypothetical protein [Verrucomicrobiae bacterium]